MAHLMEELRKLHAHDIASYKSWNTLVKQKATCLLQQCKADIWRWRFHEHLCCTWSQRREMFPDLALTCWQFQADKTQLVLQQTFWHNQLEVKVSDVNGLTFAVWEKVSVFFCNLSFFLQIWLKSFFVEITWERETWGIWSSLPLPSLLSLSFFYLIFHDFGHKAQNRIMSNSSLPPFLDLC